MLVANPLPTARGNLTSVTARRVLGPANLAFALLAAFGWLALLNWTGNGPTGWQARRCAQSAGWARACEDVRWIKDQERLAPYALAPEQAS